LLELKCNFNGVVTQKLDLQSQEALRQQRDPAKMSDSERLKIRKSISNGVYGNKYPIVYGKIPCKGQPMGV
jgi:hypothetical protein